MNIYNETDISTYNQAASEQLQPLLLTANRWLTKHNRYPRPHESGLIKRKRAYFTREQTVPVYSEAKVHPHPDVSPVPDLKDGKRFYYDGECQVKFSKKGWKIKGRKLKYGDDTVPCEIRNGFDHVAKQVIFEKFYLYNDTL
ncbi:hypothetical protein L4D76_10240 [Photobacterium sagamiensis]|uniref:hypothetical protein n=1 Tax=Photobacterium sagamiensis TaxID=2910241 RepID=UPI003D13200E